MKTFKNIEEIRKEFTPKAYRKELIEKGDLATVAMLDAGISMDRIKSKL